MATTREAVDTLRDALAFGTKFDDAQCDSAQGQSLVLTCYDRTIDPNDMISPTAYISNNLGVLAESPVPVEVLIHTARCILSPELLWTHVPDLLDVLAHIEQIRINIVHQAALASEWNTYYAKDPDVGRPTERELERIRAIADTAESKISRSEYYALCRQLRWHVSRLLALPKAVLVLLTDHFSNKHLAHMLVQRDVQNFATLSDMYFPPPNAPEKWYRSYLLDLSDEEKDSEVVQGERIARLAEDSERWREERSSWWKIRIPR